MNTLEKFRSMCILRQDAPILQKYFKQHKNSFFLKILEQVTFQEDELFFAEF